MRRQSIGGEIWVSGSYSLLARVREVCSVTHISPYAAYCTDHGRHINYLRSCNDGTAVGADNGVPAMPDQVASTGDAALQVAPCPVRRTD
ncbi:hypothetical protein AAKU64_003667 [Undibacterium sp. GrIS 1.8]|uniref:hypothetical protein n=1 Tax=Undibacterium sp. GrIS 1.8 TaxID=3143934 RepID=UPI00339A8547